MRITRAYLRRSRGFQAVDNKQIGNIFIWFSYFSLFLFVFVVFCSHCTKEN